MSKDPGLAFVIRRLTPQDAEPIFEALEAARRASPVSIGPKWSFVQLADECRESGLVIERVGASASALAIDSFILWRDTGAAWEISFLATTPDAQGQGLMRSLLAEMKQIRPADRPIWLEVHEQNASARALYEKTGFVQTGERPGYYADGGTAILYNYG